MQHDTLWTRVNRLLFGLMKTENQRWLSLRLLEEVVLNKKLKFFLSASPATGTSLSI
jgi:hypothetical protein